MVRLPDVTPIFCNQPGRKQKRWDILAIVAVVVAMILASMVLSRIFAAPQRCRQRPSSSGAPALGAQEGQIDEVAGLVIPRGKRDLKTAEVDLAHALKGDLQRRVARVGTRPLQRFRETRLPIT